MVYDPGPSTVLELEVWLLRNGYRHLPGKHNQKDHAGKRGRPGAGSDMSGDQAALDEIYSQAVGADGHLRDTENGDPRILGIARRQGFDTHPTTVSDAEFDRVVKAEGHEVLYRGVHGTDDASASEIHRGVREGSYRPGYGIFGNGYYMAPDRAKAAEFSDHTAGSVGRYALHRDAKTVDYQDLRDRHHREISMHFDSVSTSKEVLASDPGSYAAMLGFDAIRVPKGTVLQSRTLQHTEWVILNRGALIAAAGS